MDWKGKTKFNRPMFEQVFLITPSINRNIGVSVTFIIHAKQIIYLFYALLKLNEESKNHSDIEF